MTLLDFYGFGRSSHPDVALTLDDYVLGVVSILRKYNMHEVTLVCHSFGGRVGIKLAAKYPYYIKKIVLADSAGLKPRRGIIYYSKVFIHKFLTKLHIEHTSGSEDYKKLNGKMRETFKNIVNEDLSDECRKVKADTLIIWGNKDKDTPIYMARKLHRLIRKSMVIVFKGCGHFAYLERNARFCIIVESFLSNELDMGDCCNTNRFGRNRDRSISDPCTK